MRQGGVGIESLPVEEVQHVYPIGQHLPSNIIEPRAYGYGLEASAQFVGERASLGEQFETHLSHMSCFLQFDIYE
jgi:hypothetical protein